MVVSKGIKKARTLNQAMNKHKQMTSAPGGSARLAAATFHGAGAGNQVSASAPPQPAEPVRARSASPPPSRGKTRSILKTQSTMGTTTTEPGAGPVLVTFSSDKPSGKGSLKQATGNSQRTSVRQGRSPSPSLSRTAPARTRQSGPMTPDEYKARTLSAKLVSDSPPTTASPGSPATPVKTLRTSKTLDTFSPEKQARDGPPQTALAGKSTYFDTGRRMDSFKWNKWSRMVDKHTVGAHYEYVVGDLAAQHSVPDLEQMDHDALLADGIHRRRPSEMPHPRASSPRNPMRTAFTDRSGRMREGRGAKTSLMPQEAVSTEWAQHGDCSCDVCKPFEMKPAGNASHQVHYNKVPRCNKDSPPTQPHWENEHAHTFNSEKVCTTMEHITVNSPSPPADAEKAFSMNMGRKVKSPRPQSPGGGRMLEYISMNEDRTLPAGMYNQDSPVEIMLQTSKGRQPWQGRNGQSPSRSGVAMVLTPEGSDPPPPERILATRRGDGEFKMGTSKQAEGITNYFNQDLFRYAESGMRRGRSLSPPRFHNAAGTGTGQWGRSPSPSNRSSPRAEYRGILCNNSRTMASVMNHDEGEQYFARESDFRKQCDPTFVELCNLTLDSHGETTAFADAFKNARGHGSCSAVEHMAWN
eukprot:CAMPEP_0115267754 /NCGR_PEP_ID=MMETSP0270-20121206/52159_1 /TAXON_ID=71861 /ORGANISM="Scrippsiella trochoidea, Strain CCMP3099" /LENGTH=638 /DNA_ID=CAMNT_0002683917 /DNA_START=27 /DNA_END=1943 /DNA_ORIENTATION=+